jgi:hypothetical protein
MDEKRGMQPVWMVSRTPCSRVLHRALGLKATKFKFGVGLGLNDVTVSADGGKLDCP